MNRFQRLEMIRIKARGKWNIILEAKTPDTTKNPSPPPPKKVS